MRRRAAVFIGGVLAMVLAGLVGSAEDLTTLTPNVWHSVTPTYSGAPGGGKIFPQQWQVPTGGIYDPVSKRTCITDRWYDTIRLDSIYANAWLCYDPVTNVADVVSVTNWRVVKCSKEPDVCVGKLTDPNDPNSPRVYSSYETHRIADKAPTPVDGHPLAGGIVFDPVERAIYRINGANNSSSYFYGGAHPKETWKMSLATKVWEKVSDGRAGDVHPPTSHNDVGDYGCSIYDAPTKRIVYFQILNSGTLTWLFDPLTKVWAQQPMDASAQGVMTAIAGCAYDSRRNRILVLGGGRTLYSPVRTDPALRHMHAYSVSENKWTKLAPPPVVTYAPEFAYSEKHDVALAVITVQQADKTGLSTTYAYLPATDTWVLLGAPFNRGPINYGQSGTLTYNVAQDTFVWQGGAWNAPKWATLRYGGGTVPPPPPPSVEPLPPPPPPPTPLVEPPPPPTPLAPGDGVGRGCTTVYYHDADCDGYGVGVRASGVYGVDVVGLGDKPDADDTDPTINTPATVLAKFDANTNGVLDAPELKAFLAKHKGITAGNIYYVSPTGNNATGAANDPTKPFATYYHAPTGTTAVGPRKFVKPGDVVIFQAGIYVAPRIGVGQPAMASGVEGTPTVVMADPGAVVHLHGGSSLSTSGSHDVIVDGFAIDNPTTPNLGFGLSFSLTTRAILRNIEVQRVNWVSAMQDLTDILVDGILIHHNYEHGLYMGSRELPANGVRVRRSILYANGMKAGYGGLQFNGRVNGLVLEDNIIHSNGQWCISFAQGVSGALVQNNLCFNNAGHDVILQLYPGHGRLACTTGTGTGTICPYSQTGNVFTNNTFWHGRFNLTGIVPFGGAPSLGAVIRYGVNTTTQDPAEAPLEREWLLSLSQGNNTVQNNIMVVDAGTILQAIDGRWLDTWTFRNNVVYRVSGPADAFNNGGTKYTLDAFQQTFPKATGNLFADPQLVRTSIDFWGTPHLFDLRLASTSPAIGLGTATLVPLTDVRGATRTAPFDAGAYTFRAGTSKPPTPPTNLRIVR